MATIGDACEALCRVVEAGDDAQRCLAVQALGRIGDVHAVDVVIGRLLDPDEDVRVDAAEALGRIGDKRAAAALRDNLLGDPCNDVKANAVAALGRLADQEAAPVLQRLVRGRDDSIAWDESEWLAGGWDDWLDLQVKAIEALARIGAVEAVPDIVEAIDDEMGQDLSEVGLNALARLGVPGIAALAGYLEVSDGRLRRRAARVLAGLDTGAARAALASGLKDKLADVRIAAARGLAAGDAEDPRLLPLFDDAVPEVRATIVSLSGRRYPERLHARLDDPADQVQVAVLKVIAEEPEGVPLPDLTERLRAKLIGASADVGAAAAGALARFAPAVADEALTAQLVDSNRPQAVRSAAARALAALGSDAAVAALSMAVADADRQLRLEALAGLARVARHGAGSDVALPALIAALHRRLAPPPPATDEPAPPVSEPPDTAREAAAEARFANWPTSTLAAITGQEASTHVASVEASEVSIDENDLEYLALAKRLPRKKRVPLSPTVAAHEDIPRIAARVLGDVASEGVARALAVAAIDKDLEVRRVAVDSLARIGARMGCLLAEVREALHSIRDDSDREVRLAVARALGRAGDVAVVPDLVDMLRDPDGFVRGEAVRALARLGAIAPEAEALLVDNEPGVRLAAAEAVATRAGPNALNLLVDHAFAFVGHHRREAARLLRRLDRAAAGARFIEVLNDPKQECAWPIAIEALEELYCPDVAQIFRNPRGNRAAA
jgi:HEAT repeat protein